MSIYTKAGDEGETSGLGGQKLPKSDASFEAVGTVDELNSHLGLCLAAAGAPAGIIDALRPVQSELFAVGSILSGGDATGPDEPAVARMERQIDELWAKLPPLVNFVLPAGGELACRLHVARTVCRRAERAIIAMRKGHRSRAAILQYINRLSDLLFVLARWANHSDGIGEMVWKDG